MFLSIFFESKSLPNIFILKPTGVTTRKNINPITIGATIAPKIYPSLIHNVFKGVRNFEFNIPRTKKIREKQSGKVLI